MTQTMKTNIKISKKLAQGVAVIALTLPAFSLEARAQVENATRIADPARATSDLELQSEVPDLAPSMSQASVTPMKAPAGAENIKFTFNSLEIEGVNAYKAEDLDPFYREKLGTEVALTEIYQLSADLTRKYRNDGFILTQVVVPEQSIKGGNVKLRVVEGFVDGITVEGDIGEDLKERILGYAENLKRNGILDAQLMERYLLIINDIPGVTARSVLSPSPSAVGGSSLNIIVELDDYESELTIDNLGSRYLGPYQGIYTGSMNSFLGGTESLTTQLVIAGDKDKADELLYGSVSYSQAINNTGTTINLLASATETEPGADLEQFDVRGKSRFWSARLTHPLIRSRTTNLYGRATFDWRDTESKNNIQAVGREDNIRSLRLGTTLQFMDTILSNNYVGINAIDLEVSQGLDAFGASDKNESTLTRANGNPYYTKVTAEVQRLQRITPKVNVLLASRGQLAAQPLLSAEEFSAGGSVYGRGYDSSEIVGEDGIAGKVEAQWNTPYAIDYIDSYQVYGFWDAGRVWNQDATTSANKRNSIASTGLGVRANIDEKTKAGVGVAFPLTRRVDTTNDRGPRYFFTLSRKF